MISTHILDTSLGRPAQAVKVQLEKEMNGSWSLVKEDLTNADGRINFDCAYEAGVYRLTFDVVAYMKQSGQDSFFQSTPVVFKKTDTKRKNHLPHQFNTYCYTTNSGS